MNLMHSYDDLTGTVTVSLNAVAPHGQNATEEDVVSVPFAQYEIPDFTGGRSAVQIVQDLTTWLEPGGLAHRMLDAQVMYKQMKDRYAVEIASLTLAFGQQARADEPARVTLDMQGLEEIYKRGSGASAKDTFEAVAKMMQPVQVGGVSQPVILTEDALEGLFAGEYESASDALKALARIQYLKQWLRQNKGMLDDVVRGGDVSQEQIDQLARGRLPQEQYERSIVERTMQEIQTYLAPLRARMQQGRVPAGVTFSLDPKENGEHELVAQKGVGKPQRIQLSQIPKSIDDLIIAAVYSEQQEIDTRKK
jgi:hypothetical protein